MNISYFKNIFILVTGTVIAQIIPALSSPLLTRLYTPVDLGLLATYLAIISSVIPAICGKYEMAIVLPYSDEDGEQLLGISLYISLIVSFFSLVFSIIFFIFDILNSFTLQYGNYIFFISLFLLFNGTILSFSYFANRLKHYKIITNIKIFQSVLTITIILLLGILNFGLNGLIIGNITGLIFSSFLYLLYFKNIIKNNVLSLTKYKLKLLYKYREFPIYSATTGLLDGITLAMPVFFISIFFSKEAIGFYSLVMLVGNAPISFLSRAVSQVNLKTIVDLVNSNQPVRPYLIRVTQYLVFISILPAFLLMTLGPRLFSIIFGPEWQEAGEYLQILVPAFVVKFISSTLSASLGATNNNKLFAIWVISSFIVTSSVLYLISPYNDIKLLLKAYSITNITLYLFYYYLIWKAVGNPQNS